MKLLSSLLFFLVLCSPVFAVCDATRTVCESGCDHTGLNEAVTYMETECSSPSSPLSIEMPEAWTAPDTTAVEISGISTTSTNNLTIFTSGDARHDGTAYKSGAYKLEVTYAYQYGDVFSIGVDNVTVDGLVISLKGNSNFHGILNGRNGCVLKNNVVYSTNKAIGVTGIGGFGTAKIYNNIVFNVSGIGIGNVSFNDNLAYFYNNTVVNCALKGFNFDLGNYGTIYVSNNLSVGNNPDFTVQQGPFATVSRSYNASSDSSADGTGSLTTIPAVDQFDSLYYYQGHPTMTANNSPEGEASASSEANGDNAAWKAMDADDSTKWTPNATTGWLAYEFINSFLTTGYKVIGCISGQETFALKDWTFDGWDGSAWDTLDTQTNQTSWTAGEERTFSVSTTTVYSKYRLNITANNGHGSYVTVVKFYVSGTNSLSDFHLKSGADAIDAGTDLSGTFTTDIDGVTRSGTWDIGADEYSAGSAGIPMSTSWRISGMKISGMRFK